MKDLINRILQDLYELEPSLKNRSSELEKTVGQLLNLRPDTKFDPQFAQRLRAELLSRAQTVKTPLKANSLLNSMFTLTSAFNFRKALAYAGSGAALATILIVAVMALPSAPALQLSFKPTINNTNKSAFGKLAIGTPAATGMGGGGGGNAAADSSAPAPEKAVSAVAPKAIGLGGGGGREIGSGIMPPYFPNYSFNFTGEKIAELDKEMSVLKRVKGAATVASITEVLKNANFGIANLDKFTSTKLQNLNFVEDREFGYAISIDLNEGNISIYENYPRWPNPMAKCQDQACYDSLRINIEDIPADAQLISMANDFLSQYGISTEGFGAPEIANEWRAWYDQAPDKTQAYVPDVITVRYPLMINGKKVYDEGGVATGLNVNVNLRVNKVASLWGLTTQIYEGSAYEIETDWDKIIKVAQAGGSQGPLVYAVEGNQAETLDIGTPTLDYIRIWQYSETKGMGEEILVPGLVFPIVSPAKPNQPFYRQNITVLLPKDLIERNTNGGPALLKAEAVSERAQ